MHLPGAAEVMLHFSSQLSEQSRIFENVVSKAIPGFKIDDFYKFQKYVLKQYRFNQHFDFWQISVNNYPDFSGFWCVR